jgi:hypothetical protein
MPTIPEPIPNPFDDVDDEELYSMQVALEYGCLRSKAAVSKKNKKHVCALSTILEGQATQRGSRKPQFPFPPPA